MKKILVYKEHDFAANINQLSVKRKWMDDTGERHAYHCFPLSLTNTMGWGISFPEDISFIWDGVTDTTPDHVKILKGERYCSTSRGNATISFVTYLTFTTDEDVTTLIMPVPNEFNEAAQCYTTLISTSFYKSMLPISWRITKPNTEITIPAGEPVASIIPISLKGLEEFEVDITRAQTPKSYKEIILQNLKFAQTYKGFTHLYRKAENYKGEKIGSHEVKSLKLNTNNI
jgi:hypothetical protein